MKYSLTLKLLAYSSFSPIDFLPVKSWWLSTALVASVIQGCWEIQMSLHGLQKPVASAVGRISLVAHSTMSSLSRSAENWVVFPCRREQGF